MKAKTAKPCQWSDCACANSAVPTERFCPTHRRAMLKQMAESGYLQELPGKTPKRAGEAQEIRRDTQWGIDR